jgi:hypothetical protein
MSVKDRRDAVAGIIDASQNGVTVEEISKNLKGFRLNISNYKVLMNLLRTMENEGQIESMHFSNRRGELYFPRR